MGARVIDLLEREWTAFIKLCSDLDEAEWNHDTELPGWTVRDVVSHIIGTERMLANDEAPPPPEEMGDHVRNPIGEANEAWVDARRGRRGDELVAELREVTSRRLDQLKLMSREDFERVGFTPEGQGPYRQFMEIRAFDCWEHEQDIRRALDRPGHLDGPVAEMSIDRVAASIGYVVGKKAAAPEGSTVVIDVYGPVSRTLPVVVEGRARVLDEVPDDPTVTIRLDTENYNALGCGRRTGGQAIASGKVEIVGDEELGVRVLDNMAFTI